MVSIRKIRLALGVELLLACVAVGVAADFRAQAGVARRTGINAWGFRGPARFHKEPNEKRIAIVGGSAAFGAGVPYENTLASRLETAVNLTLRDLGDERATVVNLAEPGAGARSYAVTLRDYRYLVPDVVCFYDGYSAVDSRPAGGGRRASLVFRAIGYLPAIGNTARDGVISSPDLDPMLLDSGSSTDTTCRGASSEYCAAMADAVSTARAMGASVVVVTPPSVSARHARQQRSLAALLEQQFSLDSRFTYVNRGMKPNSLDGDAIQDIANSLVVPMLDAMRRD